MVVLQITILKFDSTLNQWKQYTTSSQVPNGLELQTLSLGKDIIWFQFTDDRTEAHTDFKWK